ncbi:MAG: zf-HC2 domain-containing protein [Candidatus Sericytochromatia bacterium]|nr:zf-HC2 domain-containing protein [Candidatus Sericytochromatia bacterium]
MTRCELALTWLQERCDDPLSEEDSESLRLHLASCPSCAKAEQRLAYTLEELGSWLATPVPEPLPLPYQGGRRRRPYLAVRRGLFAAATVASIMALWQGLPLLTPQQVAKAPTEARHPSAELLTWLDPAADEADWLNLGLD